jgi:hypothetical protein
VKGTLSSSANEKLLPRGLPATSLLRCMSQVLCRFLGRRHDEAIHALWRPASEKRQGTKSREMGLRRRRGRYGDSAAVRDLSAG